MRILAEHGVEIQRLTTEEGGPWSSWACGVAARTSKAIEKIRQLDDVRAIGEEARRGD